MHPITQAVEAVDLVRIQKSVTHKFSACTVQSHVIYTKRPLYTCLLMRAASSL